MNARSHDGVIEQGRSVQPLIWLLTTVAGIAIAGTFGWIALTRRLESVEAFGPDIKASETRLTANESTSIALLARLEAVEARIAASEKGGSTAATQNEIELLRRSSAEHAAAIKDLQSNRGGAGAEGGVTAAMLDALGERIGKLATAVAAETARVDETTGRLSKIDGDLKADKQAAAQATERVREQLDRDLGELRRRLGEITAALNVIGTGPNPPAAKQPTPGAGDDPIVAAYAANLTSETMRIRLDAVGGLKGTGIVALTTLIGGLSSEFDDVRGACALALGSFGPRAKEALPALGTLLSDSQFNVRDCAKTAIRQIRGS